MNTCPMSRRGQMAFILEDVFFVARTAAYRRRDLMSCISHELNWNLKNAGA